MDQSSGETTSSNPGTTSKPPSSGTKKKVIWAGIVVAAVILLKVGAKFGLGLFIGQGEIEASKYLSWNTEFKEGFVGGCKESMKAELAREQMRPEVQENVSTSYCRCMADKLEGAHVVKTKYNRFTSSEEEFGIEQGKAVEEFMASSAGQSLAADCVSVATAPFKEPQ